jgi:hypothetical protein
MPEAGVKYSNPGWKKSTVGPTPKCRTKGGPRPPKAAAEGGPPKAAGSRAGGDGIRRGGLPAAWGLPAAIIAAQREAEEKKEAATAATRIKGATLAELAEENGLLLEEGWLKCIPCLHHAPRLSGGRSGTQQPGCFNALRRLSELKVDLCKHFQRPSHTAACNAAAEKERQEKAATSAGWNIGRAIYYRACPVDSRYSSCVHSTLPRRTAELLEAMSHISYERMIVLLDGCGINVGTLNHSRKFMASFLPSLHFVFRSRMQRFFAAPVAIFGGRLLPFAWMSDKLTVKRITQEAGGVIYMDVTVGELKALFVSCEPVPPSGSTPDRLAASHIKVMCETMGVKLSDLLQRAAGFAYDGAYIRANARTYLLKEIKSNDRNNFTTVMWDVAHQFELSLWRRL